MLQAIMSGHPPIDTASRAWQAVLERDSRYDGRFVYAVRTTKVFCRPSCPSRRPVRKNVVFFPVPLEATRQGYRPCRRCRPLGESGGDAEARLVLRLCRHLEADPWGPSRLEELGRLAGMSSGRVRRLFKRATGVSPKEYADTRRLARLKAGLRRGRGVSAALFEAGYGSSSRVYEKSNARLGMTPAAYGQGGAGMQIEYTITDSPMGRLLVGATERGVCAVSLGDADQALIQGLQAEYPNASVRAGSVGLSKWVQEVSARLRGERPRSTLPLDIQATAFQSRVWRALLDIPAGEVRSYGAVARALGRPSAARAVALACATNPVAVVIPCHRVVRGDGEIGGYRWGVERKRALLGSERH
jgi:AraC family transcriptional regulator of adaptative response/methylated-DNA-[protein]-cysteine methyltransferase